jgi:heme A synthase
MSRLARFGRGVFAYNVGVVLWGAYVRATGSGAGCGAHWPLCNGEVLPRAPSAEMLVEFSHRVSSGLALVSVVALLAWTWRAVAPGHPARRGAAWAMLFMLTEAAVGAGLVLFRLVADNATMARAMFMAVHLINTFVLLAFLALTAWWLSGGASVRLRGHGSTAAWLAAGVVGLTIAGASGAVAALGDTLYPSTSVFAALSDDLSATSHVLIRLRVLHPAITIVVGCALIVWGLRARLGGTRAVRAWGSALAVAAATQLAGGFLNVLLLAPVWMQLVHLLLADAVWISYVLLGATVLGERDAVAMTARELARG